MSDNVVIPELRLRPLIGNDGDRAQVEDERDRRLLDAVRVVPGVAQASLVIAPPLGGMSFSTALSVPGLDSIPVYPGGGPYLTAVSASYFATIGTAVLHGRPFLETDRRGSEPVAIVSQSMARALWPDREAIGQCLRIGSGNPPCSRIVGVAVDVHRNGLKEDPALQYYVPLGQEVGVSGPSLLIRTTGNPDRVFPAIRQALLAADAAVLTVDPRRLSDVLDAETRTVRLGLMAFGLSGGLALVVALLGIYSLMSYMVAWRTHEIGVRMALGATNGRVVRLVVQNVLFLALVGIAGGIALALVGGRWVEPYLFETGGRDPLVYGVVTLLLLAVSLLAGWLPARRAVRISPTAALRAD